MAYPYPLIPDWLADGLPLSAHPGLVDGWADKDSPSAKLQTGMAVKPADAADRGPRPGLEIAATALAGAKDFLAVFLLVVAGRAEVMFRVGFAPFALGTFHNFVGPAVGAKGIVDGFRPLAAGANGIAGVFPIPTAAAERLRRRFPFPARRTNQLLILPGR